MASFCNCGVRPPREGSARRHRDLEEGAGLGALLNLVSERSLPTAAQFDRQIVDHASVTSRLGRDADRVSQIPFATDEPMQHDGAILDRYRDMFVVEIRV